jgi:hypothetical protein
MAALGDQAHAIAVALQAQPIAVVFDFMKPIGGVRNLGSSYWNAGFSTVDSPLILSATQRVTPAK